VILLLRSLYLHVLLAIALGVWLGAAHPELGVKMQPLGVAFIGVAFIRLIKVLIGPVIFCTVVAGIAKVGDVKEVGKTGGLALLYFEIMSTMRS